MGETKEFVRQRWIRKFFKQSTVTDTDYIKLYICILYNLEKNCNHIF